MPAYRWSDPIVTVFVIIPLILGGLFAAGVAFAWRSAGESQTAARRAAVTTIACVGGWMAATAAAAHGGVLREWERNPPPFLLLLLAVVAIACAIAFGPAGRRLSSEVPLWILVAVQSFRLPLEIAMHQMSERGIMPAQMSYA